jgi:hypothetical protein
MNRLSLLIEERLNPHSEHPAVLRAKQEREWKRLENEATAGYVIRKWQQKRWYQIFALPFRFVAWFAKALDKFTAVTFMLLVAILCLLAMGFVLYGMYFLLTN